MSVFLATWERPGKIAVEHAWTRFSAGGTALDAIEAGLIACEMDPELLAIGLGSLPNADGELELDAAVMRGDTLECGAVCAMRGIVPAISVARRVMEDTPHVMLAGDQARRFAISKGYEPRNLMTSACIERYETWRTGRAAREYVHTTAEGHGDTVTMLSLDDNGKLTAASSTSGLSWKLPGRVGDSPIVGAGIYADDEVGAAGATGLGEELWKACASFRVVEFIRQGLSPQEACNAVVAHMIRRQRDAKLLPCVVLALGRDGQAGAATTSGTFHLWRCEDGGFSVTAHTAQ